MKFVNQKEYPHWLYETRTQLEGAEQEKGRTTTVKTSGCGLCSAVMVAHRLIPNCRFELKDALDLAYECGANRGVGTEYHIYAPAFAQKLGLRLEITHDVEALLHCLRTGGAAVARVDSAGEGQGLFTRVRHYVTVINQEPDGRLAVLDPDWDPAKFDEPDRRGRVEIVHGSVVLCDVPTFVQQARTDVPPYYLFWRG